jgi:dolichol-phosphate mannosyltransferase
MEDYRNLVVILPTLNEEENISQLLDFLIASYLGISILIVDDSSTDATVRLAKSKNYANLKMLERTGTRGLTASIIDGINAAGTEFVVVMDSDFQHPPEKIPEILRELEAGADLVVMRRTEVREWPVHRRLLSLGAELLANLRLSINGSPRVSDVLSGYFGARRDWALKSIASNPKRFEPQGYKFLFDLLKGEKAGIKISELGYIFGGRARGSSKIGLGHVLRFLHSLFI